LFPICLRKFTEGVGTDSFSFDVGADKSVGGKGSAPGYNCLIGHTYDFADSRRIQLHHSQKIGNQKIPLKFHYFFTILPGMTVRRKFRPFVAKLLLFMGGDDML